MSNGTFSTISAKDAPPKPNNNSAAVSENITINDERVLSVANTDQVGVVNLGENDKTTRGIKASLSRAGKRHNLTVDSWVPANEPNTVYFTSKTTEEETSS